MPYSTRSFLTITAILISTGSASCTEIVNPNCADNDGEFSGYAALVSITDTEGRPATFGTTVRLVGRGVDETVIGRIPEESIIAIGDAPGLFTIVITRPWWVSQTVERVNVPAPEGPCGGIVPTRHSVVMELKPDAPSIRQVVAEIDRLDVLSDPPYTGSHPNSSGETQFRAFVEADRGASIEIEWTSWRPDIAAITADGILTVPCRTSPIDTHVLASSKSDPAVFTSVGVTVLRTTLWTCPEPPP